MKIRSITANEIEAFAMITDKDSGRFKQNLTRALNDRESFPKWCFVAEEDGKFTARVAYWAFTSSSNEIKMMGLHLPWDKEYLAAGQKLIRESLRRMRAGGATGLEVRIYSDSTPFLEKQTILLQEIGMPLIEEKKSFLLDEIADPIIKPERLTFRSLAESDEETFIDAIKRVTEGTLDRDNSLEVSELGAGPAALNYFNILKDIEYKPAWWQLAYKPDGKLAGLVVPQKFSADGGVINYIGVVPDERGNGYVNDLLARGSQILKADGIKKIIADIDVDNFPLAKALLRAGYKETRTIWVYKMELKGV